MLNGEKDLNQFINKPAFKEEENDLPLSLALAATNKYSDQILGLIYNFEDDHDSIVGSKNHDSLSLNSKALKETKQITFKRN